MKSKFGFSKELNPAQTLVLGFAGVIIIGMFILSLPIASLDGKSVGIINALFTATSAVCVTGLVVVDTGTYWTTFGKVVILLLIQIGGLGFMTMATSFAFLVGKRITLRSRIIMQEALNQFNLSGIVRLTRYILLMTFSIEAVGAFLLSIKFIPIYGFSKGIFYGIFHSISAFCNAGFDLIGDGKSLTPFVGNITINFVVMTLIIVGGLGFAVIVDLWKQKNFKRLGLHSKLVLTSSAILIGIGFIFFFAMEYSNPATLGNLPFGEKIMAALFQSVTPRTAGFNTIDIHNMNMGSKFFTIIYMFIGGSPGSTAGGIKTTTFCLVLANIITVIRGKENVEMFKRRLNIDNVKRAMAIFSVAMSIVLTVTMLLSITESNMQFLDLLFETVSAVGTVGLTTGITSSLSPIGKIIISIAMFTGRLGPLTIVIALARRKNKKTLIRYPESKVLVG